MSTFNVKVIITKHPMWLNITQVISAIILLGIALIALLLHPLITLMGLWLIALYMVFRKRKYKDTVTLYDDLNMIVTHNKTSNQLQINLMNCYRNNQVRIINYEHSSRIKIIVTNEYGHKLIIIGNKKVNEELIFKFINYGLKVEHIIDFWLT